MPLNVSDFSLFFYKNCNLPWKKVIPLSQQPPLKVKVLSSPPILKIWKEVQPHNEKGGCTLWCTFNAVVISTLSSTKPCLSFLEILIFGRDVYWNFHNVSEVNITSQRNSNKSLLSPEQIKLKEISDTAL